jgi:NAD(P)-dependent dehydrogenase (short-subunit alcohol dehydrogenase family)
LPEPDYLDLTLAKDSICLITDDGSLTTTKLAQLLTDRGWKVVVISFPDFLVSQQCSLPDNIHRVVLSDLSEQSLQQELAKITTNYGSIGGFIHLHPLFKVELDPKVRYLEKERAIVKQVFLMAKHLTKMLNRSANRGYSCFMTAARLDGAFGFGENRHYGAIAAGLFGLTKTLNQEWQSVFCRAIDLSPSLSVEESVRSIVAELHDPNRSLTEVGYSSQGRTTLAI